MIPFSGLRDPILSHVTQLLLFKPIRVSKADVMRMGDGEGKETTEKGKLETWCIVFHSKWNRSTCKQDSTYIRPAGDFKELLINTTHKHSLERVLDLQSLSESLSLSSLNGSLSSCLDSLFLTLTYQYSMPWVIWHDWEMKVKGMWSG